MRIKLEKNDLSTLFEKIYQADRDWRNICKNIGVCSRTIRDWKRGETTIPYDKFNILATLYKINTNNLNFKLLPDFWNVKKAAKAGAIARYKIYGNPGTSSGRSLGGKNSLVTHSYLKTNFIKAKEIAIPHKSSSLAELMGIMTGDGHITKYQTSVTTNSITDLQHAKYTASLFKKIFKVIPVIKKVNDENTVIVLISSCRLTGILEKLGMPRGNKINHGLKISSWIKTNKSYLKSFIRGIFDTDGCIYIDKHKNKKKIYRHLGLTITSYSPTLISDILKALKKLGFSPTNTVTQKSIYLRRQEQIEKFFKIIGSNNKKHQQRYKLGRVPKWS